MKKLEYNIYKYSSYTSVYVPENIKVHNSTDLTSRWSSESNIPPQYLVLKLVNPAIVKSITFGKYEQTHVCNIKKFQIFGGLDAEQNMIELLDGGLKNDSTNETFELRHTIGNGLIPIRYIKIVPLVAWGLSVNFTIWFVELHGIDDPSIVEWNTKYFIMYKEQEIIKLCLKHFRQRNYSNALQALQQDTNVSLEDPLLTEFHNILVDNADYEKAEKFLENIMFMGLFSDYIKNKEYRPIWKQIDNTAQTLRPGMRGGHQMCIDPLTNTIYLFGGWDGNKDLNDLWSYDVSTNKWTLICLDASVEGGPSPRSCHKMCLDTKRKQIFMLGRYLDLQYRTNDTLQSDFYMYDIESGIWNLLTEDTKSVGGPYLIFDHQICMDCEERTLYVFGGRVLSLPAQNGEEINTSDVVFSGLYAYHVSTSTWRQLLVDTAYPLVSSIPTLVSRVGHSMLFHPGTRKLYIFAGQRNKEYLTDFLTYHVDTHTVEQIYKISDSLESGNYPAPGFTQRATIDPDTDEIFVLSGLSKEKEKREDNVQNSVWVFRIKENKWKCIYVNENACETHWKKVNTVEPCPRFAHQLVYDHITKTHYLFGGNPGRQVSPKLRLDDFWKLTLCKPSQSQLLQKCKFLIRKHHFEELSRNGEDTVTALTYLRTKLYEIIDHQDARQIQQFHLLASLLFCDQKDDGVYVNIRDIQMRINKEDALAKMTNTSGSHNLQHFRRSKLYEKLIMYFPKSMTQPIGNLAEIIHL